MQTRRAVTPEPIVVHHSLSESMKAGSSLYVYAVVRCEIKLFQNYFSGLLQLMNIFQHVQCRLNNFSG